MKVELENGKLLDIGFSYYPEERTTVAYVVDPQTGDEWKEYAIASKQDQFNRKVGRKLALGRALQHMYPTNYEDDSIDVAANKAARKLVWNALVKRGMKLF